MAKMDHGKISLWLVIAIVVFGIIAIPTLLAGQKNAGAGPQPSSSGGGTGA